MPLYTLFQVMAYLHLHKIKQTNERRVHKIQTALGETQNPHGSPKLPPAGENYSQWRKKQKKAANTENLRDALGTARQGRKTQVRGSQPCSPPPSSLVYFQCRWGTSTKPAWTWCSGRRGRRRYKAMNWTPPTWEDGCWTNTTRWTSRMVSRAHLPPARGRVGACGLQ